jgi:hypothetical protein
MSSIQANAEAKLQKIIEILLLGWEAMLKLEIKKQL